MKRVLLHIFFLLISVGFAAEQILLPQLSATELSAENETPDEKGGELLKKVEDDKLVTDYTGITFPCGAVTLLKGVYLLIPASGVEDIPYCPPERA